MRIAVVGSRHYRNLENVVTYINSLPDDTVIVSGHAKGVDQTAERAAKKRGLEVVSIPANWDKYGKPAGYRRNIQMLDIVDKVVVFWDGKSPGTRHMIDKARKRKIDVLRFPDFCVLE